MIGRTIYFKENDLASVEKLQDALAELALQRKEIDSEENQRRSEIAKELVEKIKTDDKKAPTDKVSFLNAAIVHYAFASRKLGALKRGLNSLFSGGEGPAHNLHPYFQSTSQSILISARDEIEKECRSERHHSH
ncbi:hypothetical protein [Aquicella lusitana]|uniref:Uncharacterized protein n=1 Tax=Aquicella lusitana TaxID=254246 RepID=A0A370GQU1_9COXI|nr:hypothetical protein [Aquicella lusitana]RDI46088.1 hypothetical protein C8D86_10696 [Aquicella lusitana]VVC73315.1 hypothetical protein AQULUS_10500 [Aquicella lusitana]